MTRIRWCSLVGCWCQLSQASSCVSVKLYHTASGLCCMINTSHWRMVFDKPCNCLHRMCSHSACCVSAFSCGCWVYCLFIRTLGLQVMTSLLQCSSVWSVCASLIWYIFHLIVLYTQVFLQLLAQLVFIAFTCLAENRSHLSRATNVEDVHNMLCRFSVTKGKMFVHVSIIH